MINQDITVSFMSKLFILIMANYIDNIEETTKYIHSN